MISRERSSSSRMSLHPILHGRVAAGEFIEQRFPLGNEPLHADTFDTVTRGHRVAHFCRQAQQFAHAIVGDVQTSE